MHPVDDPSQALQHHVGQSLPFLGGPSIDSQSPSILEVVDSLLHHAQVNLVELHALRLGLTDNLLQLVLDLGIVLDACIPQILPTPFLDVHELQRRASKALVTNLVIVSLEHLGSLHSFVSFAGTPSTGLQDPLFGPALGHFPPPSSSSKTPPLGIDDHALNDVVRNSGNTRNPPLPKKNLKVLDTPCHRPVLLLGCHTVSKVRSGTIHEEVMNSHPLRVPTSSSPDDNQISQPRRNGIPNLLIFAGIASIIVRPLP